MKMKKKVFALLTALLLLTLTACGGAKNSSQAATSPSFAGADFNMAATDSAPMEPMPEPAAGWEESYDMPADDSGSAMPANIKVILTGDLELETKEFDTAVQAVDALVQELGGWYESRSINQGGYYRSISATIRVPARNFSALMERAGEAAHKTYANEYQQDVSETYYDNEARLTTQRTKLERLQTLLAQAESMEDIITLESAISETELQIEYLTGSLRKYDSLVNYSTVNLSLREVYRLSTDQEVPLTFGQRLGDAFITGLQRGIDGLEDFTIGVARNWMTLLIWAVIIVVIVLLVQRYNRKRRSRPMPPPPFPRQPVQPQPQPKQEENPKDTKK